MDIGNKIYSSIMCGRIFRIISKHGVKCQFGSTPGVGCQDDTFTIKTLINLRHNHNLPTWVAFADLFKAFDTSNHVLIIAILVKYGAPPKTTLRDQTHVRQNYSQARHRKGGDIHQIKSECQTRRQHGLIQIFVINDGLCRNTIR